MQIQFTESAENTEYLWIYFVVANLPVYLCCCYHPPKPNYSSAVLVEVLCSHMNQILLTDSLSVIILAGLGCNGLGRCTYVA